jgi:predicted RNA-binding protein with RPS1 domain
MSDNEKQSMTADEATAPEPEAAPAAEAVPAVPEAPAPEAPAAEAEVSEQVAEPVAQAAGEQPEETDGESGTEPQAQPVVESSEEVVTEASAGATPQAEAETAAEDTAEPAPRDAAEAAMERPADGAGQAATEPVEAATAPTEAADAEKPKRKQRRGRPRTKLEDLVVGTETTGKVVHLAKFGCFVDIGAVTDGLVHITEFPKRRVRNVEDVVKSGDEVYVWIKGVDLDNGRISLSMRKKPQRPIQELQTGTVLTGTVTSVTKYGAFVDIASDTEGLVHISEMSSGYVERPSEIVSPGDTVEVRIKEIDGERQRISLSMVGLANDMGLDAEAPTAAQHDEPEEAEEPEERMPTVVELALRRALGEDVDGLDSQEPVAGSAVAVEGGEEPKKSRDDELTDLYERMLEEYRSTQSGD